MTDQVKRDTTEAPSPPRRRWLGYAGVGVLGALLGGAALSTASNAEPGGRWFGRAHWGHHRHGWFGHRAGAKMAQERMDYVLFKLDATAEQRSRVRSIVTQTVDELGGLRAQHHAGRRAFVAALSQPQVDRTALETLRTEQMRLANEASARLVQGLADAADVLTPEQRAKLGELVSHFGGGHH